MKNQGRPQILSLLMLLVVSQISLPFASATEPNWKKVNAKEGITVYSAKIPNSSVVAFKGEGIIDAPSSRVYSILLDNEKRKEWVDRLKVSNVLERISPTDYIIYQEFELTWPINNRDFVYRGTARKDSKTGVVTLLMKSTTHPKAPATVGVRAQLHQSRYVLKPIGKNKTHLTVEIHSDPMGLLPKWLVNLIQKSWPLKTLRGIRKQAELPYWETAPTPTL